MVSANEVGGAGTTEEGVGLVAASCLTQWISSSFNPKIKINNIDMCGIDLRNLFCLKMQLYPHLYC